jgi:hypothetical protein
MFIILRSALINVPAWTGVPGVNKIPTILLGLTSGERAKIKNSQQLRRFENCHHFLPHYIHSYTVQFVCTRLPILYNYLPVSEPAKNGTNTHTPPLTIFF